MMNFYVQISNKDYLSRSFSNVLPIRTTTMAMKKILLVTMITMQMYSMMMTVMMIMVVVVFGGDAGADIDDDGTDN